MDSKLYLLTLNLLFGVIAIICWIMYLWFKCDTAVLAFSSNCIQLMTLWLLYDNNERINN